MVSRSSNDNRNGDRGRRTRGRTPPDWVNQECPVVFDTPAAATACFNVAPLARAVKNLARTSADFGFLPTAHLHRSLRRSEWRADLAMIG
jgi:hypothetical protein